MLMTLACYIVDDRNIGELQEVTFTKDILSVGGQSKSRIGFSEGVVHLEI